MNPTFLSDVEKSAVIAFAGNSVAFEAVKKVLLFSVYTNGTLKPDAPADPMRNFAIHIAQEGGSNEEIGANLKAHAAALNFIESGFNQLLGFKADEPKKAKANPAL